MPEATIVDLTSPTSGNCMPKALGKAEVAKRSVRPRSSRNGSLDHPSRQRLSTSALSSQGEVSPKSSDQTRNQEIRCSDAFNVTPNSSPLDTNFAVPGYLAHWVDKTRERSTSRSEPLKEYRVDGISDLSAGYRVALASEPQSGNLEPSNGENKSGLLAERNIRRSNLVDDLLMPNDSDESFPPDSSINSSHTDTQGKRSTLRTLPAPRGTSESRQSTVSIEDVLHPADTHPIKRRRLKDLPSRHVPSQKAKSRISNVDEQLASGLKVQSGQTRKRRGRPPGSRNKDKLLPPLHYAPSPRQGTCGTIDRSDAGQPKLSAPLQRSAHSLSRASTLRHRELGGRPGLNLRNLHDNLRRTIVDQELSIWKSWEGASKDVITAAWSPDGVRFAAGASTDLDALNLGYNRNNNLLWGDVERGTLAELPDHHLPRSTYTASESNAEPVNVYDTLDHRVFTTVSSICFNHGGDQMYTAGYDQIVKVWDVSRNGDRPKCVLNLQHRDRVELLSRCESVQSQILATAQRDTREAVSVFDMTLNDPAQASARAHFTSERAEKMRYFPTALRWGVMPSWTEHLLLAGFAENRIEEGDRDRQGDLLLWDVREMGPLLRLVPAAQCVFDLAWHPYLPLIAAATTPGSLLSNRKTKSVIRTWAPFESGSRIMEFECPALDVNEISFHPFDHNYVCAACTNGCAYMWDVRRPDDILHVLPHGHGIEEVDDRRSREEQDTGMRFVSWNKDGSFLYTGSSDGSVKQWNPFAAKEDCFVRDIATFDSGIMTGTFSPDYTSLLIGLCKGSIQVLSSAPPAEPEEAGSSFSFEPSTTHLDRSPVGENG